MPKAVPSMARPSNASELEFGSGTLPDEELELLVSPPELPVLLLLLLLLLLLRPTFCE
jgi:hypothetical protein